MDLDASTATPSSQHVDLRLLDYVDGFDRNLECPICHCPFIEATRLPCDHTFCAHCLHSAFHNQSSAAKSCPSCRSAVSSGDQAPMPRFVKHMIDDLTILCPNHEAGCSLHMRRGDVEAHVRLYCPHAQIPCPASDCPLPVKRKDCTADCLHVVVDCELCDSHFLRLDQEDHLQKRCPKASKQCPHCQDDVLVRDFEQHVPACPKATVRCAASTVGCRASVPRDSLPEHEANCTMVAMLPFLNRMSSRNDCQEVAMQALRSRNHTLESALDELRATIDAPSSVDALARAPGNPEEAPFDSPTHHLLSMHESLRGELDRVAGSITDLDGRISMMVINENLRLKEELTHMNAVINSMRMQLQWLTSARLQHQSRIAPGFGGANATTPSSGVSGSAPPVSIPSAPVRRLSDSSTKL